jgi:hypothetical protein
LNQKFIPKRPPNIELFSKDEIALIDKVLGDIVDQDATELRESNLKFLAYQFADKNEELPLFAFSVSNVKPKPGDYEWAMNSIKAYEDSIRTKNETLKGQVSSN